MSEPYWCKRVPNHEFGSIRWVSKNLSQHSVDKCSVRAATWLSTCLRSSPRPSPELHETVNRVRHRLI